MSKIICDVCGTSYAETATQCPICGCVRSADAVAVRTENSASESSTVSKNTYTYVKGGRFSKANVRKRNNLNHATPAVPAAQQENNKTKGRNNEKGLIIAVCVLLLAIAAVVIYIVVHLFAQNRPQTDITPSGTTAAQQTATQNTTLLEISCEGITIDESIIELDQAGAAYLLNVILRPVNTTDYLSFASSDPDVATVNPDGKIVAVAPGEAYISISCGAASAECKVVCTFAEETVEETQPSEEPSVSPEEFKLNREDFSLGRKGETWKLYTGTIPVKQIVWTSDNEKVATIVDGVVTAVGKGYTTVHGEYNGIKISCIVRCKDSVGNYSGDLNNSTNTTTGNYTIGKTDVTIKVGETFALRLLDENKKAVDVIWDVADQSICSASGNDITGLKSGTTTVSVNYDGETYTCTVRVQDKT